MTTDLPAIFAGLPIYFHGVDDTTPPGCQIVTTSVFDQLTTYLLRDGQVIGRIEHTQDMDGYLGTTLKGGGHIGTGEFTQLAQRIADHPRAAGR